ncbi:acyl-CoA N-acyltransferases (NAT) superfamily protein [Actinidia rufa]|uniref:Acyl-CoA N-acyltransferases (NAT) superfamily protein n=1 Tax=Actinidia rufa TaxID=165716 RepID=A0A7J0FS91_9ERIC|nr:acyl-CoA N-acyltransferases (NAT) superfamily protein [Actinidia rufa]
MAYKDFNIRSYNGLIDKGRVEDLERRCAVGPAEHVFFIDTMGDPICRIRNSPMYNMLVAELDNELVGVIQGSIKQVTVRKNLAKVGYVLGLRVSSTHRHKGIGSSLVHYLVQWFVANQADYAYMATDKDNHASINLFAKLGFVRFRTPAILVHPVNNSSFHLSPNIKIAKLKVEQAEFLYRKFMGSVEFFPHDIDKVLGNKLSLGTWVAYPRGQTWCDQFGIGGGQVIPNSWAMVSVWNSTQVYKLRIGKQTVSCFFYKMYSRLIHKLFPCFELSEIPDFLEPFGFYFMYGVHQEGPGSGKMVRALCKYVHNMARKAQECKVLVTEVEGENKMKLYIPHWKLLSCSEDLWCIKALKNEERNSPLHEMTKSPTTRPPLFVDPREV